MNISKVGKGRVVLLAGGGKIFTDIAARFVKSERSLEEIIASSYDKKIVSNIINSGHKAALEFDYFIFGIEGYARVTETQLVRKRIASYLIKSGRTEKKGKRSFDMVIPESIENLSTSYMIPLNKIKLENGISIGHYLKQHFSNLTHAYIELDTMDILRIIELWYTDNLNIGIPEEELRYLKPQATEFKAIIGMNCHALIDWFKIRCCKNAQTEIRDLAAKMLKLCKKAAPDLFINAGPNCVDLGYCPENQYQNKDCSIITKEEALKILKDAKNDKKISDVSS